MSRKPVLLALMLLVLTVPSVAAREPAHTALAVRRPGPPTDSR